MDLVAGTGDYREERGAVTLQSGLVPFEVTFHQGVGSGELKPSLVPPDGVLRTASPSGPIRADVRSP